MTTLVSALPHLVAEHEASREALLRADARHLRARLHLLQLLREAGVDALTLPDGRVVRRQTCQFGARRMDYCVVEKGD